MTKSTEETPIIRRSTYIDANTGLDSAEPAEASESLRQTIAEARAVQVADLQAKLEEAEHIIRQKQEIIDSISLELGAANAAITELKKAPNGVEAEQVENAEEAPTAAFVRILDEHLSTHSGGPTAILNQMERRGPVERAGYLASLERLAAVTREKSEQLDDLRRKSEIAGHLLGS